MKNILCSVFILLSFNIRADEEKAIDSEIKAATVFLNKAQLLNKASATLSPGKTELIISNIPVNTDPNSIRVSGKGDFTIADVSFLKNYTRGKKKSREMLMLEDSLDYYQFQLGTYQNFEQVLKKEEELLVANQNINGKEKVLDADDLEYMANFFRNRLLDIRYELLKNERQITDVNNKVVAIKNQMAQKGEDRITGNIIVTVTADKATPAELELEYIVRDAGWVPAYDIRASNNQGAVSMVYKAHVKQNTGIEWNNVDLTLSTGNPAKGGNKPEMKPWHLSFQPPRHNSAPQPSMMLSERIEKRSLRKEPVADHAYSNFTSRETMTAVEFKTSAPYNIPSDNKGKHVEIASYDLPATYKHHAVPKLSEAAYLVAEITEWDELNLLSGKANIFFDGTFVTTTNLNVNEPSDTLSISLGRDQNVMVKREQLKEFKSKSFLGLNRKEEMAYSITVRNMKNIPVTIIIQDQVPVSRDSQIEVEVLDTGNARYSSDDGSLTWERSLDPANTETVQFRFGVKYPKKKRVQGL